MPDDPSNEDVASVTNSTSSSWGKRGSRKPAQRGILPVGFVLNGIYEIKRFIARGGMGEVYEGANVNAEERVAVKVILPHLAADPKVQALFRKEAKTLTSLAHPALVQYRVLAREPRKDLLYIVTDFIDGEPLTNLIGRHPPTTGELVMLTRRLAEGLHAAHSHGAIHRDISPENVLLPDGLLSRAKIIDFGIAKSMEIGAQTVVGDGFAGKLGYVAPEQFGDFDRRIGPWTDIYSLALVVLALAGGRAPNMGTTLVEAIDRRRAGADMTAVPPLLQPLFARMLSPDPRSRPQTMAEVISALDALDVPLEPPSTRSWNPDPGNTTSKEIGSEIDRTVIHLGSEPPSWQSAEPRGEDSLPLSLAAAASDGIAPEGRTIFAPEEPAVQTNEPPPTDRSIDDDAPRPVTDQTPFSEPAAPPAVTSAASSLPSLVSAPSESEAVVASNPTIYAPGAEPPPEPDVDPPPSAIEIEPQEKATRPPAAFVSAELDEEEDDATSPIPPAMDVAYRSPGGPTARPSGEEERQTLGAAAARGLPKGRVVAISAVAAVIVVGVGFAVLSSQKKAALPAPTPPATSAAPLTVSRADEVLAAALPNVPCSWLTLSRGQNADGSTNIKISGAAGDPAGANRAVASAARATGAAGLQVDTTEILPADPASCPLFDTVNRFRGQSGAVPSLVAQQARFEIDRGIQGCPKGLWSQSMINVAPDPSRGFSLIAIQPSGRLQQFTSNRDQFAALAARNPDLYKDLGGGRYRVSMCQNAPGLAGVLMIEGDGPFDIGLRPGAIERPTRDFPARLGQLAQARGWTMQMAWFQLVNDQPDLPEQASTDEAERHRREMAEAAKTAAAAEAAKAVEPVEAAAPVAEPQKLPADYVACRRFVNGAWEELGYAQRAACVEKVFAGRCDVLTGQSGDIALRRYNDRLQAKTGRGFKKWDNVGKSDCAK
ncbi:serine/threonine-protein kinase [Caulobacter sp. UNC279MFTsu5.1]|uniref:serine/threonine-protein kinase n=1 Tax=Caulobacter sp. UNC279MFTsu5.1 TaxID=1502775 RepID=UPI0008F233F7|nr:serine/threonine protein kinase [Caulobacter sp. UNC279MFTsu5.1]SFJ95482.1 Serine/threonine protein kinase [Caulobacter sp. UNC279MFTsu5.1]